MEQRFILSEAHDGVLTLTFDRAEVLNSFTRPMVAELTDAVRAAETDASVRAVVMTGAGRAFCAGQDLAEAVPPEGEAMPDIGDIVEGYNELILAMRGLEKPIVAAVNGVAAGAGANIALACDFVIAAETATFIQAFAKIGLVPDNGGTFFLPRLVGTARAFGLALFGEKLSAEQAEQWGLIWKAVDDEKLAVEAQALAASLATGPTKGYGLLKKALHASHANSLDAQLDLERDLQREAGFSEDYREGVAAFMQKRPPVFKGK